MMEMCFDVERNWFCIIDYEILTIILHIDYKISLKKRFFVFYTLDYWSMFKVLKTHCRFSVVICEINYQFLREK